MLPAPGTVQSPRARSRPLRPALPPQPRWGLPVCPAAPSPPPPPYRLRSAPFRPAPRRRRPHLARQLQPGPAPPRGGPAGGPAPPLLGDPGGPAAPLGTGAPQAPGLVPSRCGPGGAAAPALGDPAALAKGVPHTAAPQLPLPSAQPLPARCRAPFSRSRHALWPLCP